MYSVKPVFFFSPPRPSLYFCVMHCSSGSGCLYKANVMREREETRLESFMTRFPNLTHPSSPLGVCWETEAHFGTSRALRRRPGRSDGAESHAALFLAPPQRRLGQLHGLLPTLREGWTDRRTPSLYSFLLPPPPLRLVHWNAGSYLNAHLPGRCFNVDCCIIHFFFLSLPPSAHSYQPSLSG